MPKSKKNNQNTKKVLYTIVVVFCLIMGLYLIVFLRNTGSSNQHLMDYDIHNLELLNSHRDKVFGIDISQYQGEIQWRKVNKINNQFPINFVIIRATMGSDGKDEKFDRNWKLSKKQGFTRGVYHYYRPNENSNLQILNFISKVELEAGDLPPVLDIEERPTTQSMDSLRSGLKKWLTAIEDYYGVRPIIYSSDNYYKHFLEKEFSDYPRWIANYNFWIKSPEPTWNFWQFSEKGTVNGIKTKVDLNIFNGNIYDLDNLTVDENTLK
ncbi:glycoside hydrolase family 25 protein [Vaginella massiliensis]|uniref:glycoside hydrolase family 25 protein n=1 Tax=Vaginella massiliensis TaxID=1816680 RepID=UPI003752D3BB